MGVFNFIKYFCQPDAHIVFKAIVILGGIVALLYTDAQFFPKEPTIYEQLSEISEEIGTKRSGQISRRFFVFCLKAKIPLHLWRCSTDYLLGEEEESERTVEFSPARLQEAMGEMSCEEFNQLDNSSSLV